MAEIVGIHSGGTVSLIIGMACIFAIVAGLIYADGSAKRYIGKFRTRFRIGHILERFSVGPDGRRPGPALRACANSMRAAEGARHEVEFRRRWRERSGRPQPSKRELSASKRAEPISCSNVADERNFSASATEAKCASGKCAIERYPLAGAGNPVSRAGFPYSLAHSTKHSVQKEPISS